MTYEQALTDVVDGVVAPGAVEVDHSGSFPRRQIDALGAAGLLALTVPQELGGGGQGMRAAATVVPSWELPAARRQ